MVKKHFNYVRPEAEAKIQEILGVINPNNEPENTVYERFADYILAKKQDNPDFNKGVHLIQTFMNEVPDDYMGLLYCYAVLKNYYLYESGCIWAEFLIQHLPVNREINLYPSDESLHGSTLFFVYQTLIEKVISFTINVHFNSLEDSLYKWQLSLLPDSFLEKSKLLLINN